MKKQLVFLIFLLGIAPFSDMDRTERPPNYVLVGQLSLLSPQEDSIFVYRDVQDSDKYLLKIKRNTVDSRFMNTNTVLFGWITIPVPVPFIPEIIKKHQIRYKDSDKDWDYFTLELE